MGENTDTAGLLASLRMHLEDLLETGMDELPLEVPKPSVAAVVAESAPAYDVEKRETLEMIGTEMANCHTCSLGKSRKNLVFGVGNPHARLVFVGEAPGRDEDLRGEPFVGEAGQLLTKIIGAMGFSREEVYICNVLKCRPPGNRNPLPAEIEVCMPYLLRQIESIKPDVVVALGTFAGQTLLATRDPISRLRGRFHDYHGIPLMPTFHPAFLLRNPEMKREVWDDMKQVMSRLGKELPEKGQK